MKIVLCTSDFFYPVHESIREGGHHVERVYTSCDLDTGFSDKTRDFADEMKADFRVGRVTEEDIQQLSAKGVDLLISAAYDFKIPTPDDSNLKLINVHGSLLPHGRGPWPQPWLIMKFPEYAGVTFHSMTQEWDKGDIVLQRPLPLLPTDDMDSLIAKTLVSVKEMTQELLSDPDSIWQNRRPMEGAGSYWRKPTIEDMTINLNGSVTTIDAVYRAFGSATRFIDPNSKDVFNLISLSSWKEGHKHAPGTLITVSPPRLIYAASDGFVSVVRQPDPTDPTPLNWTT